MQYDFSTNKNLTIDILYVGEEQQPIVVVDNLLACPESVICYAETGAEFQRDEKDFYPGVRKPLSPAYAESVYQHLLDTLWMIFSTSNTINIKLLSSVLSLATTPPENLRPIQSVPHFDSFETNQIAAVHYLCQPEHGGTSFYRHRSTGFESMNKQRLQDYAPMLKQQVIAEYKGESNYMDSDTPIFERTQKIEAQFNRAIFYRSNILHSGNVQTGLSANPRSGRLTANTLVTIN